MEIITWLIGGLSSVIGAGVLMVHGKSEEEIKTLELTKADKTVVDEIHRRQILNEELLGKSQSNLNDAIETWRVAHEKLMEKMHENHLALLDKLDKMRPT